MEEDLLKYIQLMTVNINVQQVLLKLFEPILLKHDFTISYFLENKEKINHICDWIKSVVENKEKLYRPRVLTLDALNNAANKYFKKKNNKLKTIELDETHEKLIADLGNYYVVQMLTSESLDNESKVMQHCIGHGGYDKNLMDNDFLYLSLRDKFNKAHATLEIHKDEVIQLQGKQNKILEKKYINILLPWLVEKYYVSSDELKRNSYIKDKYGVIYSINDLPEVFETQLYCNLSGESFSKIDSIVFSYNNRNKNFVFFDGVLDLSYSKIKLLSNTIETRGSIELSYSSVEEIEEGLSIGGSLILNHSKIKNIPNFLRIGGDLILSGCSIDNIYNNVFIGGSLKSVKTIKYIGENLHVSKELNLEMLGKFNIGKGLYVGCELNISYSDIDYLPSEVNVGTLKMSNSKIQYLPEDIIIRNDIFADGSELLLFDVKNVNGDVDLQFSKVKEIGENIFINGNLDLKYTNQLEKIGKNLIVNGDISLNSSNLLELENVIIKGNLLLHKNFSLPKIKGNTKIKNIILYSENSSTILLSQEEYIKYIEENDQKYNY